MKQRQRWHPLTKLLLVLALPILLYLLWTELGKAPATVAKNGDMAAKAAGSIKERQHAEVPVAARAVQLLPMDAFTDMVERPLFSPTRRPPRPPAEPKLSDPPFRLVGTIRQNGSTFALLSSEGGGQLTRATLGDTVEGWEIVRLEGGELVVQQAEEERQLTMFR